MDIKYCAECGKELEKSVTISKIIFLQKKHFCSDECWKNFKNREFDYEED